jgi:hypothetical protein
LRGAFAAGQDQGVDTIHIAWSSHEHMLDAHSGKRRAMRLEISLNGKYADFHAFIPSIHFLTIKSSVLSVAFLRVLCVKFRQAQHRGHKESQRATEKSASSL